MTARAVGPIIESSVGTLRQPMHLQPLVLGEPLHDGAARVRSASGPRREERKTDAVGARRRQLERGDARGGTRRAPG